MAEKNDDISPRQGFKPENRKKLTQRELNMLDPTERGRYLAYEDPPKSAAAAMDSCRKRVQDRKRSQKESQSRETTINEDSVKYSQLIGQLKAAEARNRLRIMRLQYQNSRAEEVKHLISCQPTAIQAVRLQAMVPPKQDKKNPGDRVDKLERARIECILEDEQGLTINRDLT